MDKGLIFALHPGIQIAWSRAPIDGAVISYFIQLYSILLSTLLSINRQQLSLFDANHALIITLSFLVIRLVFTSFCNLSGIEIELSKRIQSHRATICTLGVLFLPLWFGVNLTILLSNRGFIDGELCSNSTFKDQLLVDPILLVTCLYLFIYLFLLLFLLLLFLFHHLSPLFLPGLPSLFLLLATSLLYILIVPLEVSTTLAYFRDPSPKLATVILPFSVGGALFSFAVSLLPRRYVFAIVGARQLKLIPRRNASTRDPVFYFGCAFILFECGWAAVVIRNTTAASGSEYVLSYGQV